MFGCPTIWGKLSSLLKSLKYPFEIASAVKTGFNKVEFDGIPETDSDESISIEVKVSKFISSLGSVHSKEAKAIPNTPISTSLVIWHEIS